MNKTEKVINYIELLDEVILWLEKSPYDCDDIVKYAKDKMHEIQVVSPTLELPVVNPEPVLEPLEPRKVWGE